MKLHRLDDMFKGWFIGDFEPVALRSRDVEVAIKNYRPGDTENVHHHKVATEITVIVSGEVRMLDRVFRAGDIITVEPGERTPFEAVAESVTVVVKLPSVIGDKYPG